MNKSLQEDILDTLKAADKNVADLIRKEMVREQRTIRLIASENYASEAVMLATGSIFTNKYCEGYANKRYYLGQEFADKIECLAIDRAKQLFGADHVNVQPYSGSPANFAAYLALANPGAKIMGMDLPHGGHLTHGWKVNFTGKLFEASHYQVDAETERIDYDKVREQALEVRPDILICGASAYPRIIDFEAFASIANECGAKLVADMAHISGLVAAKVHPSPVPHADVVTTTTHKTLRGPRGGMILCKQDHAKAIDRAIFPGMQGGPHMNTVAALAIALEEALKPDFTTYAKAILANASAMADMFSELGYRVVSGGTDNHLLLVDMTPKGIGGKAASIAMEAAGIVCNSNTIPFDTRKPFDPSGIRIGTAAVTTRGMDTSDMRQIVKWIDLAITHRDDAQSLLKLCAQVHEFTEQFEMP